MKDEDFYWLIGLLEGEGHFGVTAARAYKNARYRYPLISLKMTDEDVVARAAKLLECSSYFTIKYALPRRDTFEFKVTGERAAVMMQRLRPFMGLRRRQKITEILDGYERGFDGQIFRRHRSARDFQEISPAQLSGRNMPR